MPTKQQPFSIHHLNCVSRRRPGLERCMPCSNSIAMFREAQVRSQRKQQRVKNYFRLGLDNIYLYMQYYGHDENGNK